jgi:hypothetical protein
MNFRISMWVWMRESQDSSLKMTIWITLASTKNHMFLLGSDRNNVDVVMATNGEPQLNHNLGWVILRWVDSAAPCLVICVSNRLKWHQSGWTFPPQTQPPVGTCCGVILQLTSGGARIYWAVNKKIQRAHLSDLVTVEDGRADLPQIAWNQGPLDLAHATGSSTN